MAFCCLFLAACENDDVGPKPTSGQTHLQSISFSSDTYTIVMGNNQMITASGGIGSGSISYSSSDDTIASITSAGLATANAIGSATITAVKAADSTYAEAGDWRKGKIHKHQGYAAMLRDLDLSIGTLLAAYKSLGLAENTYLIFTSDNGGMPVLPIQQNLGRPYQAGLNLPLLRGKWDLAEGGIRVPFAIIGPGIKPGSQSDTPVVSYDLLPTLADLAGSVKALPEGLDGGSLRPLLDNPKSGVERPFDALVFHFPHYNRAGLNEPHSALRHGDYKLLKFFASNRSLLFKVSEDIGESTDLSGQEPERTKMLEGMLVRYLATVQAEHPEESPSWRQKGNNGQVKTRFLERYAE